MKSKSYKRLGDYIQKVNVRNTENLDLPLMGLTIEKKFIPSVANTIGTDLSKYKIVYKNQFACSLMQVSRDGKLPIARLNEEAVIMSPAYPIFKVTQPEELMPEYLEMWFKREEFDREAAFYAVGGVRGNLTWEDFCDLTLPIPSIEKQREIVAEYQAVENKIKTNEAICEKLEETAQTIYRRWFEEFEFPYSPPLEGCPKDGVVASPPLEGCPKDGVVQRATQNYMSLPYNPALKDRAKALRKAGNLAEVLFWKQVRNRQFLGLDFDRQKIIGNYIVDFYNANYQLVIEIDGSSHDDKQDYDAKRDAYLQSLGLKVLHFTDLMVKHRIDVVMNEIEEYIKDLKKEQEKNAESADGDMHRSGTQVPLQGSKNHPALQAPLQRSKNHPAFQAPLQRRGRLGYKSAGGKMVWNDEYLNDLPKGWRFSLIGDEVEILGGGTPSTKKEEYWKNGEILWYSPTDITNNNSVFISDSIRKISQKGLKKSSAKLFPANSLMMTSRATIGKIAINTKEATTNQGFITIVPNKNCNIFFLYCWIKTKIEEIINLASGSTFKEISKTDFNGLEITLPDIKTMKQFELVVTPSFNLIENIIVENQKLRQFQSLLLGRMTREEEVKTSMK